MDGATNPAAAAAAALAPALLTLDLDAPTPLVCDVEGGAWTPEPSHNRPRGHCR